MPQLQSPESIFALSDAPELADVTFAARRVLAMAAAQFYRQGAAGTSIRDITSACGLTPGAFYKHFASKDEVLYALVRHGHDRLDRRVAISQANAPDQAVDQYAAFVRAYVGGHLDNPELAQLVRREYLHLAPDRYDEIVRRRRGLRTRLARLLQAAEATGAFTLLGGADRATRTAVMVLDMCSRTSEWYHPEREGTSGQELTERYVEAALRLAGAAPTAAPTDRPRR